MKSQLPSAHGGRFQHGRNLAVGADLTTRDSRWPLRTRTRESTANPRNRHQPWHRADLVASFQREWVNKSGHRSVRLIFQHGARTRNVKPLHPVRRRSFDAAKLSVVTLRFLASEVTFRPASGAKTPSFGERNTRCHPCDHDGATVRAKQDIGMGMQRASHGSFSP